LDVLTKNCFCDWTRQQF